jgi:protein-disulfide isomerase
MTGQKSADDLVNEMLGNQRPGPKRRFPVVFIVIGIVVALVLVGILVYLFVPLEAAVPDDAGADYLELEKGYTDQGFPRLGRADAPIVVEEFSSYACPHCRTFHEEQFKGLLDQVKAGQVQFVLIPIMSIGPGAENAAKGALCAGEQDHYWEMHDTLFYWQGRYLGSVFSERRIRMGAENLGLDMTTFDQCMDAGQPVLEAARAEFERRDLTGTPSVFINGEKVRDYQELENLQPEG